MPKNKLKSWTDSQLKKRAVELDEAINVAECFGWRDLIDLNACCAELGRRGYEVEETKALKFSKKKTSKTA